LPNLIGDPATLGALRDMAASGTWQVTPQLAEKGWAGAGIWYNKVAELNGNLSSAALNVPMPSKFPWIMEYVMEKKKQQDQSFPANKRFEPNLSAGTAYPAEELEGTEKAVILWEAFKYWDMDGLGDTAQTTGTSNFIIDTINKFMGTSGLYSILRNPDVHPLAQLVGVGRSLIESSVRNLLGAGVTSVAGAILSPIDNLPSDVAQVAISFIMMIVMIGMTAGFVMFYIIPFLPFIYFFFAFSGWIKGIFEAMVGAPLWALAHIRIDGNGLPGQAAVNGYFLIFEIFLRPILIVFGFLASVSIFSAMLSVMNDIWSLVTANLSGFDVQAQMLAKQGGKIQTIQGAITPDNLTDYFRGPVDRFFFTIVYAIVAYMMAMSSFKLIDLIPNNILRWMGQSVATFNDQQQNPAESLVGTATVGAQQTLQSVGGGVEQLLKGVAGIGRGGG
jgi:conjugal transfer/type IV secretion protein DotA/TraY